MKCYSPNFRLSNLPQGATGRNTHNKKIHNDNQKPETNEQRASKRRHARSSHSDVSVLKPPRGDKGDVAFEDKRGEKRAGGEKGGEGGEGEGAAPRARGKRVRL